MKYIFNGVATALTTPFTKTDIDFNLFERQIDRQLKAKVDALVFLGTTGEAPTITRDERRKIIDFARSILKGKIPIIVGTGSNSTSTACDMTSEAKELGADCALIVTPYYNRCEQDGLILHYKEISTTCKFPFIVYNVPTRTGVNVEPTTVNTILKDDFAFGLKEANSSLEHVDNLYKTLIDDFAIYCGNDSLTSYFLNKNCTGTISVASNVIPFKIKEFISDFKSNYEKHKYALDEKYSKFFNLLTTKINPIPIKCLQQIIYGDSCVFRLPLSCPDKEYFEYLKVQLDTISL